MKRNLSDAKLWLLPGRPYWNWTGTTSQAAKLLLPSGNDFFKVKEQVNESWNPQFSTLSFSSFGFKARLGVQGLFSVFWLRNDPSVL